MQKPFVNVLHKLWTFWNKTFLVRTSNFTLLWTYFLYLFYFLIPYIWLGSCFRDDSRTDDKPSLRIFAFRIGSIGATDCCQYQVTCLFLKFISIIPEPDLKSKWRAGAKFPDLWKSQQVKILFFFFLFNKKNLGGGDP